MAIPNKAIVDAWADMKPAIDKTFGGDVTKLVVPARQKSCSDLRLCSDLNPSPIGMHGPRNWSWRERGEGVLEVNELRVSRFDQISAGKADFSGDEVLLPIDFDTLELRGRYSLTMPCVQTTAFVGETGSQNVSRSGAVTETYVRGTLVYHLKNGEDLVFTRVSIENVTDYTGRDPNEIGIPYISAPDGHLVPGRANGYYQRQVEADRDGGWWVDQLSGRWFAEAWIGDAMTSTVQTADFSKTMIASLTKRIGLSA